MIYKTSQNWPIKNRESPSYHQQITNVCSQFEGKILQKKVIFYASLSENIAKNRIFDFA